MNIFNKKVSITMFSIISVLMVRYKNLSMIHFIDYVNNHDSIYSEYIDKDKKFYRPLIVHAKEVEKGLISDEEGLDSLQIKTKDINIVNDIINTFNNIYQTDEKDVKIVNIMNITDYMDKDLGTKLINDLYELFQDDKFELKYYLYDYMINSDIDIKTINDYKLMYPDYEVDNYLKVLLVLLPKDNYNTLKIIKFIINDNNILEFEVY